MRCPAWWPWVSRSRYELADEERRSAKYAANMAETEMRYTVRQRDEARARVVLMERVGDEARAEIERLRADRDSWASAAREAYELLREQRATYVQADNVYRVLGDLLRDCDEDVQALFDKEDREMGLYGEADDEA